MNRRMFIAGVGAGLISAPSSLLAQRRLSPEIRTDVLVAGGGVGGVAAALAACRAGRNVVMTEETLWIGGQLTSQAVPPDEHPWIEEAGCTRSYRAFRNGVRRFYRDSLPLSQTARDDERLNPGAGWVSLLCHEPKVALTVLESMIAPYVASGKLTLLLGHRPIGAAVGRDRVEAVVFEDVTGGGQRLVRAPYVLDATELGEVLPIAGVEHVVGAESRAETGEPSAPETANPQDQQAITWCFAIEHHSGENHVISRPDDYERWRDYLPKMTPAWPGKLFSWETSNPVSLEPRQGKFDPSGYEGFPNLWSYRRIRYAARYADPKAFPSVSLINWPQNDYWVAPLVDAQITRALRAERQAEAKALSRAFLYWMQTDAPRPDGGTGWPGLKPSVGTLGTRDGFAMAPYIRESRRIRALFTVTEKHVATAARMQETGQSKEAVRAATFEDSVGVGAYRIDLHPSTGGRNYVDVSSLPFQIPLGSLIPQRIGNVLAAAKNIGVTHITNGCYRLHPVEWNIGEAAGALAAFCLERKVSPVEVHSKKEILGDFQKRLRDDGFELEWTVPVRPL